MSEHPRRAAWRVPRGLGRRGATKHPGTQSSTMHEMTREKISFLWFKGERSGWDLGFAASRRHREVFCQAPAHSQPGSQPAACLCLYLHAEQRCAGSPAYARCGRTELEEETFP